MTTGEYMTRVPKPDTCTHCWFHQRRRIEVGRYEVHDRVSPSPVHVYRQCRYSLDGQLRVLARQCPHIPGSC